MNLQSLANEKLHVAWREEIRRGSPTKIPKDPNRDGNARVPTDPSTYGTRAAAEKRAQKIAKGGIGIVLGKLRDGQHLAGIDLDSCRDAKSGVIADWAKDVIERFDTYAEISPSGTGVKLFYLMSAADMAKLHNLLGRGIDGEQLTRKTFAAGNHREVAIDTARFYAITDRRLGGRKNFRVVPFTDVAWFITQAGPSYLAQLRAGNGHDNFEAFGGLDMSGSGFGFRFMQACRRQGMSQEQAHAAILDDRAEAGEWARRSDKRQLDRAWKRSEPPDGDRRAKQVAANIEIGDDITEPIVPTIMTLAEMLKRLVFIGSSGVIVDRANGRIRKREIANSEYAASLHHYKKKAKSKDKDATDEVMPALKAWLASPQRVSVDVLAWMPGAAQICRPPESTDGAMTAFNSWRGLSPMMDPPKDWKKQAKPFLDHVAFLVPIKSERKRFLQWLVHIVQHPEVLPHTSYLMITRTTGIGRNLLASMIVRVLRGHVAVGVSLPELLDGGFTGRLSRKLLAIVDEVREGGSDKRFQRGERLKSLITEVHRHINIKYGTQSVEKNCCRWLMFSNHHDALPFDNTDRRIEVIDNPTEQKPAQYYERLFALLDDSAFIASVRKLLLTIDIFDFRPGQHAVMNEAKTQALHWMRSDVERCVIEFKEECKTKLATREDIRKHASNRGNNVVNENHLTHAIAGAGMVNARRRVKDENGVRHSIVIVSGGWTIKSVEEADAKVLLKALKEEKPQGHPATRPPDLGNSRVRRKK